MDDDVQVSSLDNHREDGVIFNELRKRGGLR